MDTLSLKRPLGLALVLAASATGVASAQVIENINVSVTLNNALAITENTPLNFGTITMISDGTNAPAGSMTPAGAFSNTSTGTSNMLVLTAGTAGSYTVSTGIPSFTNVTVSWPLTGGTLSASGVPSTNGSFTVVPSATPVVAPGAGSIGTCTDAGGPPATTRSCTMTTNGTGDVTFALGGTITASSATANFQATNTVYTGTIALTANFS
ncbi:hypothetical protein [Woodsholea maritima]|uniref:hypothetical protein n=1 Tax=Woodsholea maritima TaxID=240237 RepID=UPI00036E02AF|nr:hypothetical protein [Woodsholea maritima]